MAHSDEDTRCNLFCCLGKAHNAGCPFHVGGIFAIEGPFGFLNDDAVLTEFGSEVLDCSSDVMSWRGGPSSVLSARHLHRSPRMTTTRSASTGRPSTRT